MLQQCAIFDADDTLWKTQELYDTAIDRFESVMYIQGFNPREAHDTMMAMNVELAQQHGALPENFAHAMVETYNQFCQGLGVYYSREVARELRAIGAGPYIGPVELYEGTRYTLETLRQRDFKLILCTAGEPAVQLKKLTKSGLHNFFDRVYVVPRKTYQVFDDIIDENGLLRFYTYMIGNSVKSDVNPSTTAEIRCFWLNQGSWAYDLEPIAHPWRVYRINKITDVLTYLQAQQLSA